MTESIKIPNHIAIVMDGNGRWATARGLSRIAGHKAGTDAAHEVVAACNKLGVKYLTLYAFSSENWQRPPEEIHNLMTLLRYYLKNEGQSLHRNNVKIQVIGNISKLDEDIRQYIQLLSELTKANTGLHLILALSYGSREEITEAARNLAMDYKAGKISLEDFGSDQFSNYLYTKNIPDPDLLIRTSGEQRVSNFLIWQMAYTEFYFSPVLWPDFTKKDLNQAIKEFNKRERRYGL